MSNLKFAISSEKYLKPYPVQRLLAAVLSRAVLFAKLMNSSVTLIHEPCLCFNAHVVLPGDTMQNTMPFRGDDSDG